MVRHFSTTAAQMEGLEASLEQVLSGYSSGGRDIYICNLLYEEIAVVIKDSVPAETPVCVKVGRKAKQLNLSIAVKTGRNIFDSDNSKAPGDELQSQIRGEMFRKYRDRMEIRYNSRSGLLRITISAGASRRGRDLEGEIEKYYASHRGRIPSAYQQIGFLLKKNGWGFFLSFLIRSGRTSPMIVIPVVTANLIDIVIKQGFSLSYKPIRINIAVGILSLLLNVVFSYLESVYFRDICRRTGKALRNVMVKKLQMLSFSYHNETQTGVLTSKLLMSISDIEDHGHSDRGVVHDNLLLYGGNHSHLDTLSHNDGILCDLPPACGISDSEVQKAHKGAQQGTEGEHGGGKCCSFRDAGPY